MSHVALSIIIVNWNGMGCLPACLLSIARFSPSLPFEVIIVDNASTDRSRDWLASVQASEVVNAERVTAVLSDENVGFGRANNRAIHESQSEFVFILNPDTEIKEGTIDCLIESLKADPSCGAVAPRLLNPDGSLQSSVASYPPNPIRILFDALGLVRLLPKRLIDRYFLGEYWSHADKRAVPAFWGTAILAKREMIDDVGGFDPDFFMYGEDVEWCVRMNRRGWKTVFVPEAEIVHFGGKSTDQIWNKPEICLRKDAAEILVEEKTLYPLLVSLNSFTRAAIYLAVYLKRGLLRQERDVFKELAHLQWGAAKVAFINVFAFGSDEVDKGNC